MAGIIYLLHFELPYRHARHYLGYSANLEGRLAEHRAGRGSPQIRAALRGGVGFVVARTWPGDRPAERRLHRMKNSPARLCSICRHLARDNLAVEQDPA